MFDKDTYIAQLEEINKALSEKLAFLNKRAMKRHDEQSLKWREKAFYYKKRYEGIKLYLREVNKKGREE